MVSGEELRLNLVVIFQAFSVGETGGQESTTSTRKQTAIECQDVIAANDSVYRRSF